MKNRYETHIKPFLREIHWWAKRGLSHRQIAKNLGVAYSTLRSYANKETELEKALLRKDLSRDIYQGAAEQAPGSEMTHGGIDEPPRGARKTGGMNGTRRADRTPGSRGAFEAARKKILATQSVCGICGKAVDFTIKSPHPLSPTVDHIIPVSKGGHPSDIANLQLAHRCCNREKSDKVPDSGRVVQQFERVVPNDKLELHADWKSYRSTW